MRSASQGSASSMIYWESTDNITKTFFAPSDDHRPSTHADIPSNLQQNRHLPRSGELQGDISPVGASTSVSIGPTRTATLFNSSSVLKKRSRTSATVSDISSNPNQKRARISTDPNDPFHFVHPTGSSTPAATSPGTSTSSDHRSLILIAYDPILQRIIDNKQLSIGVQWEIARLISMGRIDYGDIVIEALDKLKGTNSAAAPNVVGVLIPDATSEEPLAAQFVAAIKEEMGAKTPWLELDKELAARKLCPTAGLGCNGNSPWYGGKVHFIGKLRDTGPGKGHKAKFAIELERPTLGPSSRFARRFGSHSFLRVNIRRDILNNKNLVDDMIAYFRHPFVLNGRIFRMFFAKERSVFLYLTNERLENGKLCSPMEDSLDGQMSILKFLNWHNSLEHNPNQAVAKWAARFALGLSNSVPGLKLEANRIYTIDDVASPYWNGKGKLPSELDMTDGCGFANAALLKRLREKFEWENFPTAVQCRLGGAKGLLLLHPSGRYDDPDTVPAAWVRPSQTKIKYAKDEPPDDALLTIDVLRSSKVKTPGRLSAETIICLAENGVEHWTLVKLMLDGLNELVAGLTTWDGRNAMESLFYNVARVGGVMVSRMGRELAGESRAKGFGQIEDEEDEDDEDDLQIDLAVHQRSTAWWDDQISGQPSSLQETAMSLIASGFEPRSSPVLAAKLKEVTKMAIETFVKRYKIVVPMSCLAYIVPDPLGVLKEGEVYVNLSGLGGPFIGQDGEATNLIIGNILVMRHPCKVPSDIQKVKAVDCSALHEFCNVIIFSIQGKRSLASILGGGDYDGDKVIAIWQPELVNQFTNADPYYASQPPGLKNCFVQNTETVKDLLVRVPPSIDPDMHLYELQTFLLGSLKNQSIVGSYSVMHDNAVYEYGYFHQKTKRLAYMFCACLDGSKTGLIVDPEVYKQDLADFKKKQGLGPEWKGKLEFDNDNSVPLKRPPNLHDFIMDTIKTEGEKKGKELMRKYDTMLEACDTGKYDEDLVAVYFEAKRNAEELIKQKGYKGKMEELDRIVEHVKCVRIRHRELLRIRSQGTPNKGGRKGAVGFTTLRIETRQDALRALSKEFVSGPTGLLHFEGLMLERIRASYAYYHDWEEMRKSTSKWTRFPWDVCMRDLCAIKAKAIGFEKTITRAFYEKMNIVSYARAARPISGNQ
ncbi:hypothetical protein M0805_008053 [Coniferiporia weirii]|nr:hypothetical protein M0805_008053 [Coniferiporia weirii]